MFMRGLVHRGLYQRYLVQDNLGTASKSQTKFYFVKQPHIMMVPTSDSGMV